MPLTAYGGFHYMVGYGPNRETIEIVTGSNNRFGHVHLFSDDVGSAINWYVDNLGVNGPPRIAPRPPKAPKNVDRARVGEYLWTSHVSTNNGVGFLFYSTPSEDTVNWWRYDPIDELVPTDGRVMDHIAFSYRDIQPVFDRMKRNGVEIVDGIKQREAYKMKSFFVRGPGKVLIEIVEARPLPEGVWE